jgi:RNA polymerase sigma-70 factor (ECF subfamily)
VTQDVYVRAWRALLGFRAESSGRLWLLSITRRACLEAVRRRSRWRRLTARLHVESIAGAPARAGMDEAHGLDDLITRLAPGGRPSC